jgi:amino acid adenylation domain-containing protein/non-ribosomal peptide synthase protein (TIGR01720 family)
MTIEMEAFRQKLLQRRLAGSRSGGQATPATRIPRADRTAELPLSFGQRRLWFLNRVEQTGTDNLVPAVLRLHGPLDAGALHQAWQRVVRRHEILRTSYVLDGTEPAQVVGNGGAAFAYTDLGEVPEHQREADAQLLVERLAAEPLSPDQGSPARIHLVRISPEEHLLVTVFHHIAYDGWSESVFWSELTAFYRETTTGEPAEVPQLPIQYADYASWQRERFDSGEAAASVSYWTNRLAGIVPLELPTDRPRPAIRTSDGGAVRFSVPSGLADAVRLLAAEHETTPFVVLLTAFQVLLGRYTNRDDIAVGIPVGGRSLPELQNLIGFFVNTLVMRAQWTGEQTFAALLAENRLAVLDGFDHQDVPFEQLVNALDSGRDLSRTPLVQVMFGYQNTENAGPELPGVTAEAVETAWETAKFELNLQITDAPGGAMDAVLEYSSTLFDPETVRRTTAHFERLLTSVTGDATTPIAALEYVTDDELHQLVVTANDTAAPRNWDAVHQVIGDRARKDPAAVAVIADGVELSYGELDARANRLARHLAALGVGQESVVGVGLDRGADLVITLLAVLKTGGAYVPLDPAHPADRLAYILGDAGAEVVVTSSAHTSALAGHQGTFVLVDNDSEAIAAHESTDLGIVSDPESLAYTIYTSGTTGKPKGVLISHRGLTNYLLWTIDTYAQTEGGTALFSSVAFDLVVPNLYTSLMLGRPVTLLPNGFDLADLGRLLLAAGPLSFLKMAPGHLELLSGQLDAAQRARLAGMVIAAGDSFTNTLANRWRVSGSRLASEYGPTEITIGNSCHEVTGTVDAELVSLGLPIPNTTAYVLDETLRPVPAGVIGEVYVGGVGVARGYRNRAGLTAEKFVPDPFSATPGGRLYQTGDLARVLPGGDFDFIGRRDTQVKIRGYRVERGEVENALAEHPGVHTAVVDARTDGPGGAELVAYIVPTSIVPGTPTDLPADLPAFLGQRLPGYMIPAAFVELAEIPLTSNGKVDYRALPAPGRQSRTAAEFIAPSPGVESDVAEVWQNVLGASAVGVHDSFFELGGDSIRAVALVGALREAGFDVSVRDVFEHRTVSRFVKVLGERSADRLDAPPVKPFELLADVDFARLPDGVEDAYPLSRVQLGMLFEMQSSDVDGNYHNVTSFRIRDPKPFSAELFQAAVDLVVARHEVLRTSMDLTGYSEPIQLVHASASLRVDSADFSHLSDEDREVELRAMMAAERDRLFDLDAPPLIRFFTRAYEGGWWLTFTEFHPILEGWSFNSMIMEVLDRYAGFRDGVPFEPADLPSIRYADFVAIEQRSLESEEDRGYWRDAVANHPKFTLPAAWGASRAETGTIQQTYVWFTDLQQGLRDLAVRADVPLKSVMHAAHLKVMSMLTGEESFSTGLICDTRPEIAGADRVYGMFINTVPFPYKRGAATWMELVRQVFETEIGMWPHRRFPLGEMQRDFAGGKRLADVYFNYLDFHVLDTELVDVETSIDDSPNEFPLSVTTHPGLLALISRPQDVTTANRERLGRMYRRVLESMATDPFGDALAAYLPEGEHELVVSASNRTDAALPPVTLPQLFEQQVERTPDAVAVIDTDGSTLSFGELDARANQLAHVLADYGTGAEVFVGVCLESGLDKLVALLAVGKAGGAYVPLDPAHPADRLRYVLDDTKASVLITEEHLGALVPDFKGLTLRVDFDAERIAAAPRTPVERAIGPDNLVYALYTSGSTGRPKGVLVTHKGLVNYLLWSVDGYGLEGEDGALMLGSIAFDLSIPNFFLPLIGGKSVSLLPQDRSLETLADRLTAPGDFSLLKITPAHLDVLRSLIGTDGAIDSVRTFVVGADEVKPETVAAWRRIAPGARIINEYGPTETVVGCSVHVVPDEFDPSVPVPIGVPIANMRMYVLDTNLQPAPIGVAGELYIGGVGVARGYLNRPGLTAEKFVPDPFGREPGARFYRTGDLARVRADGELDFLGRLDNQVKIRGYRIELGEIEAVLLTHPDVSEAIVVAREDTPGDRRLAAYLVGPAADPAVLRTHLAATLPDYMVPAVLVVLDELPLTAAGKVDRDRLPVPEVLRPELATGFVAPATPTEEALAEIWAEILGLDQVGVHDDFYQLGGDSILTIRIVARAKKAGLPLTPRLAVRHLTVSELAAAVDAVKPVRANLSVAPEPRSEYLPLTPIQKWFVTEPGHLDLEHYNQSDVFTIDGVPEVQPVVLERALLAVVDQHDALRLRLSKVDGQWRQRVADRENAMLLREVTDPASVTDAARALHTGMSLTDGPLLRALLVRGSGGDRILLAVHHWAVDTVSWPILRADVQTAYQQLAAGRPVALPAPTTSFADWAHRLGNHSVSEVETQYWSGISPSPELPLDHDDGSNTVADTRIVTVSLDEDQTEALLRKVPAAAGTRINEVLLAALGMTVTRWTGGDRLLVDVEGHGREDLFTTGPEVDLSRTVGWFTAVYPVDVRLPSSRNAAEVLDSAKQWLRSIPNGGVGYGLLCRGAKVRPQVILNYHGQLTGGGEDIDGIDDLDRSGRCARSHEVELNAEIHSGRLRVSWVYSGQLHEESTVRRLAEDYLTDLRTLISHCARTSRPQHEGLVASLAECGVPGASVAVFSGGEVIDTWQLGVRAAGTDTPVTARTAFQCGSVSKHVTTLVALALVAKGRLELDEDVAAYLRTWRILDEDGKPAPVTLRQLLTHTAGLTSAWYDGYHPDGAWPSMADVLDGSPPANTPPIRVHRGETGLFRYSGSHFSVVQHVLTDLTGEAFPELAHRLVLGPLGLTGTSFDPAFPVTTTDPVAHGHGERMTSIDGGWRAIPETAAAGLWTTPSDLAKIALALRQEHLGRSALLTPALARDMLTDHVGIGYGLGTVLDEQGPIYGHVGDTTGFRSMSVTDLASGSGLVVMTNGDNGAELIDRITESVRRAHPALRWAAGAGAWMRAIIGGSLAAETATSISEKM